MQTKVHGHAAPGFEAVRAEFKRNFTRRGEIGAACAVYYRGQKVVDLWGGYRDAKKHALWEEDTLVPVFSVTKGMAALCMAVAASRHWLDYDAPVTRYWPEFAQAGKENVTVRQLLAHQAGLCVIDQQLPLQTLADPDALAAILAAQRPAWEPGTRQGYHALSLGWYESELLRRVDPEHRTIGRFFQDEIAKPLGLEFYIGLPMNIPASRLATVKFPGMLDILFLNRRDKPFYKAMLFDPQTMTARSFSNPKTPDMNDRYFLSLENPSHMGIGQVRAIARAYSAAAMGGGELGIEAPIMAALTAPAIPPKDSPRDLVLLIDISYSLGFLKPNKTLPFGGAKSFGTTGASGSIGFADPEAQIGFCYAPNKMGVHLTDDPRQRALIDAVYRCVGK